MDQEWNVQVQTATLLLAASSFMCCHVVFTHREDIFVSLFYRLFLAPLTNQCLHRCAVLVRMYKYPVAFRQQAGISSFFQSVSRSLQGTTILESKPVMMPTIRKRRCNWWHLHSFTGRLQNYIVVFVNTYLSRHTMDSRLAVCGHRS